MNVKQQKSKQEEEDYSDRNAKHAGDYNLYRFWQVSIERLAYLSFRLSYLLH